MRSSHLAGLGLAAFALALSACTTQTTVEQPVPTTASADTAVDTVAVSTTTTTTVVTTDSAPAGYQAMPGGARTATLITMNNSGYGGSVVLTPMGEETTVAVTLTSPAGMNPDEDHDVKIYSGTCDNPVNEIAVLDDVQGNGEASNSTVDLPIGAVAGGTHVLLVLEDDGERSVACAELR